MNLQNLRDNYPKLISYMETNGYSKTYVDRFKRKIKKILEAIDSQKWLCYTDVYLKYTKTSRSPDYLRNKRTIIGATNSLMSMADTQTEDAGMNFSRGVLIPCCH